MSVQQQAVQRAADQFGMGPCGSGPGWGSSWSQPCGRVNADGEQLLRGRVWTPS